MCIWCFVFLAIFFSLKTTSLKTTYAQNTFAKFYSKAWQKQLIVKGFDNYPHTLTLSLLYLPYLILIHTWTMKHTHSYHTITVEWFGRATAAWQCGAVCCSLWTHLSPPAILASVIPLVHLNADAQFSSVLCFVLT